MGCDIHAHVEIKIKGRWEHYSCPLIHRNYELFGIMAGVRRDDITPIARPKGLPEDLSLITQLESDYWDSDAHSASWFNRDEIHKLIARTNHIGKFPGDFEHSQLGYVNGSSFASVGVKDGNSLKEYEDVRLIFWFDN